MQPGEEDFEDFERAEVAAESAWEEESLALLNHDLRNALGSIHSALHILRLQGYVNPLAEQAGRTIERQADQLARLADQLSALAGVKKPEARNGERKRETACERAAEIVPRRILVVDDNRDAADSTGTLLLLWGHHARVAYDGESALALARQYQPEICLVDLRMPGMTGYQLAERLRQEPGLVDTRLVALTGFDQDVDRKLSREAGFDAFLLKPVEIDALQDLLARDVRGHVRKDTAQDKAAWK
jgi:CheY-like chemotaxis protein